MIAYHQLEFPATRENRTIRVYLPNNYENQNTSYPVMYFFDGHNLFFNQEATYGESWQLNEFLNHWNKDMVIVGFEPGHVVKQHLEKYSPYDMRGEFFASPIQGQVEATMQ